MQSSQPKAAFWPAFWALAKPYWVSGARRKGVILLCSVVGFTLALVWVEVQFNDWNKGFYDTFEHKDRLGFYLELGRFAFLAVLFIVLAVYKQYLQQMLMIEWRAWLTDTYLQDWLDGQAYYRLQLLDRGTDNPDQRIADDLNGFVDLTLSLSLGLLSAIVTLVSFVGILWVISGPLEVGGVTIPGYMVWVALLYAIAGTWLTHLIGQPLIGMNFARQRVEADFRFALVRLRENSEGVALYRGEAGELAGFKARFAAGGEHFVEKIVGLVGRRWIKVVGLVVVEGRALEKFGDEGIAAAADVLHEAEPLQRAESGADSLRITRQCIPAAPPAHDGIVVDQAGGIGGEQLGVGERGRGDFTEDVGDRTGRRGHVDRARRVGNPAQRYAARCQSRYRAAAGRVDRAVCHGDVVESRRHTDGARTARGQAACCCVHHAGAAGQAQVAGGA